MAPQMIAPALLALVGLSAALTWAARHYALRRQLLDQPGERRSHRIATPRGGGIAIVLTVLAACVVALMMDPAFLPPLGLVMTGLMLVAGIGWWDDHRPLPALQRLAVHLVASALLSMAVYLIGGNLLQAVLLFFVTAALINLWNFMDGINGIASSQAIAAALGFAWVMPVPSSLAALGVAAACLGFLPFNFPRARIFMGDVGSGALGYLMAALVGLASLATDIAWPALLLPLSAFLVDAGFTLLSRMLSGQRWMEPHTQHVYQRWVKAGASHAHVTAWYFLSGLLGSTVLVLCSPLGPTQQGVVAIAWWVFLTALWRVQRGRLRDF